MRFKTVLRATGLSVVITVFSSLALASVSGSVLSDLLFTEYINANSQTLLSKATKLETTASDKYKHSNNLVDQLRHQKVSERLSSARELVDMQAYRYARHELEVAQSILALPTRVKKPGFL